MPLGSAVPSPSRAGFLALVLVLLASPALAQDGRALWADIATEAVPLAGERHIVPTAYRALAVDFEGLAAHLAAAPVEPRPGRLDAGIPLALPLPDGRFATYRVVEAPVMAPGLQARFPAIRTYLGQGVEDPRLSVRMSVTPQGVHVVGRTPEGMFYLDPYSQFDRGHAVAYWRGDAARAHDHDHPADTVVSELGDDDEVARLIAQRDAAGEGRIEHGSVLRTYRIAIASTAQYTIFHSANAQSPTVAEGLAAIVVALNRVNEVYERDVAVRMELIENNDKIIYTDPNNQPYTNNDGFAMLSQNVQNLNNVIGGANFDIGHVFSTGGGGVAGLGVVCTLVKARGVTGLPQPINDPFYIDYVAHEIGHQFRANHTFNGSSGSCGGANRNGSTAFEPGSGSTIMAYAGICAGHNITNRSDAYFHNISLTEITTFITTGAGSQCGVTEETENEIPEVEVAEEVVSVPKETAFRLTGGGSDDGPEEMLTYVWEQMDLGPAGAPPPTPAWNDTPPHFRSYLPEEIPSRFFPSLERFVLGQGIFGEGLPRSTRTLRFRLTVRDNNPGAGAIRDRLLQLPISGDAGPFRVTSQATAGDAVLWEGGTEREITWDVANTASAEFGAETVDILLSLDRHLPFRADTALVLAEAVPNDGSATITVPQGHASTRARVFVRASEGYFYAVNSRDITVSPGVSAEGGATPQAARLSAVYPNPVRGGRATVNLSLGETQGQAVRVAVYDALGREVAVLHDGPLAGGANHQLAVPAHALAAGVYYVRATGERFTLVRPVTVAR